MVKPQRNFIGLALPFVAALAWLAYSSGCSSPQAGAEETANGNQARSHLEQAAESIVAAAQESVAAAQSDEEAVGKAQLSLEALRIIGQLGDFSTSAQTDKLVDELRSSGRPSVVEAIIQIRLSSKFRQWPQLSESERANAINSFVSDVKKSGITPAHAALLVRLANMLDDDAQSKLAADAINQLLPDIADSNDAKLKRMAPLLEGIVRRLELPGRPLELEGTLLDGSQFDWESYRGKVVLVDFHASWCGPCRAEVPNVLANYRAYHDKGFEVVGVNMDKDRRLAEQYIQETGADFPTLFSADPQATGWDHPMARKYGITAIPRVILVDQQGKVVSTSARGHALGELLGQLLGAPSPSDGANREASDSAGNGGVVPASAEEEVDAAAPTAPDAPPEN